MIRIAAVRDIDTIWHEIILANTRYMSRPRAPFRHDHDRFIGDLAPNGLLTYLIYTPMRKPRVEELADGAITVRLRIPRGVRLVADQFAKAYAVKLDVALRLLMDGLESKFDSGDVEDLGPGWAKALNDAEGFNVGALSDPPIELSSLHRSARTKSGFVGVYANGKGFRAQGRDPKTHRDIHVGQAATAEAAAWKRYLHYQKHGLPYGQYEADIEAHAAQHGMPWERARESLDELNIEVGISYRDGMAAIPEPRMLGFDGGLPPELESKIKGRAGG